MQAESLLYNVRAEFNLLGNLLIHGEEVSDIVFEELAAEDFYDPKCMKLYEYLRNTYLDGANMLDIVQEILLGQGGSVKAAFGGVDTVQLILGDYESFKLDYLISTIQACSLRRKMHKTALILKNKASLDAEELPDAIAAALKILDDSTADKGLEVLSVSKALRGAHEEFLRIEQARKENKPLNEIIFGLKMLDSTIKIIPGSLIVLAGRPGHGKTTLGMKILVENSIRGVPGIFFSLEMDAAMLACNALVSMAGVDNTRAQNGFLWDTEWKRITGKIGTVDKMLGYLCSPGRMTLKNIRAWVRREMRKGAVKYIIVDYLQLMAGEGKESEYERVTAITTGLKSLAREFEIVVFVLVQPNRECEKRNDKRPTLADMKASGQIEQDADVVIVLYRDYLYSQAYDKIHDIELIIRKHRLGKIGTDIAYCDMDSYLITNAAKSEEKQGYMARRGE